MKMKLKASRMGKLATAIRLFVAAKRLPMSRCLILRAID